MDCPICDRDDAREFQQPTGDWLSVECPRCGKYRISGSAAAVMQPRPAHERLMVSAYVRHGGLGSSRVPVVSTQTIDLAIDRAGTLTVQEKQDALLRGLALQSRHPGSTVPVIGDVDHVLAWTDTPQEFDFHYKTLADLGLIVAPTMDPTVVVTSEGWRRMAELAVALPSDSAEVFVAMSFDPSLDDAWRQGLLPGIVGAGYRALRVDTAPHVDRIDDRIMSMIRASRFVVVDVTLQNRGAYFEAGFALGLGRPVVWSVRADDLEQVHFDTRQFNHVVWRNPGELSAQIRDRIVGVFGRGPL